MTNQQISESANQRIGEATNQHGDDSTQANRPDAAPPRVSVLVPARNEAENVPELAARVGRAFAGLGLAAGEGELLFVDDGSTDGTGAIADALCASYPFLRVVHHRRNRGLTAALQTGFRAVRGDYVLFLPADLESDPETDIPLLFGKLEEGYDVVAGWRQGRKEGKVFASGIYNAVSRALFGLTLHDMNWIKGFRREVIASLPPLRSDWHRFLLHIAAHQGYRIGETPTPWQRRRAGRSKFGFSRIPISFLDVIVIWFLLTFSAAPMRFFGGLGLAALLVSGAIYLGLLAFWLIAQTQIRPLFWAAGGLAIAGLLLFLIGFLAELIVTQGERLGELERAVAGGQGSRDRGQESGPSASSGGAARAVSVSNRPPAPGSGPSTPSTGSGTGSGPSASSGSAARAVSTSNRPPSANSGPSASSGGAA